MIIIEGRTKFIAGGIDIVKFMEVIRVFLIAVVSVFLSISSAFALTLTDSPPITATQNNQVIENVRIEAINEPGIRVSDFSNVIIRNVEIIHKGGPGIKCSNAPGLTIKNVAITHIGPGVPLPSDSENNIDCYQSDGLTVTAARLEGGSSGIYVLNSLKAHLSFIEGYDFRGPLPRGQLVQFNKSPNCTLEDFSAIHDPLASWPEDNVSVLVSDNCVIKRGLLDGNNSVHGVAVMFEQSNNGLLEDVDAVRQANGNFSAWPADKVVFRRSRARDNICGDQGRGVPSSNGLVWSGKPGSKALRIEDSHYYNLCNPDNKVWSKAGFNAVEISSLDFQARNPIVNKFPFRLEKPSSLRRLP